MHFGIATILPPLGSAGVPPARSFVITICSPTRRRRSQARNWKTKPMIDFIFIAVIALFFVAGELYAHWCEKL
jgi:hypothetical protein